MLDTLDRLSSRLEIAERISFVKIDTEGHELHVCRGMEYVLEASPEVAVAVEYNPSALRRQGEEPEQLSAFFHSRGFDAWMLERPCFLQKASPHEIARAVFRFGCMNLLFTRRW